MPRARRHGYRRMVGRFEEEGSIDLLTSGWRAILTQT